MTDHEIIAALHSGSEQLVNKALSVMLFEKRNSWIRRVARHLQVDPDADGFEDAFVEAVFKFVDGIAGYDPAKSGLSASITRFTWQKFLPARRTALRRSLSNAAALNARKPENNEHPSTAKEPVGAGSPESGMIDQERKRLLDDTLRRLGAVCQEALTLWSLDYSYAEISERLKRPNANSIIQECRERLNRWVGKHPRILEQLRPL